MTQTLVKQCSKEICGQCGKLLHLQGLHKDTFKQQIDNQEQILALKYYQEYGNNILYSDKDHLLIICYSCFKHKLVNIDNERTQPIPRELKKIKTRQQHYSIMLGSIHSYIENQRGQSYYHLVGDQYYRTYNGDMMQYVRELNRQDMWWTHLNTSEQNLVASAVDYLKNNNPLFKVYFCNYELLKILSMNKELRELLMHFKDTIQIFPHKGEVINDLVEGYNYDHKYNHINRGILVENDNDMFIFPVDIEYSDYFMSRIVETNDLRVMDSFQVINKEYITNFFSNIKDKIQPVKQYITDSDQQQLNSEIRDKHYYNSLYVEEMLFPQLFPTGSGGYNNTYQKLITAKQYVKMRLLSCRTEYRLNSDYIFFWYDKIKKDQIASFNRGVKLVNPSKYDTVLTKEYIVKDDIENVEKFGKKLSRQHIDTPVYWQGKYYQLRALIKEFKDQYGIPHPQLFLTFTLNENDINLKCLKAHKFSLFDPVATCCHFHIKVRHLLRACYGNNKSIGIFGKVIGYYERVEFQQRGAPHFHVLIWLDQESEQRLDDGFLIQATYPSNLRYQEDIKKYQNHECRQNRCFKNDLFMKCKFGYPFNILQQDQIINNRWHYKRNNNNESNIVPFNLLLTLIGQSNITVLRLTTEDITQYMVKYLSKQQPELDIMLKYPTKYLDKKDVVQYLKTRKVSSCNAVWQLLGFHMVNMHPSVEYDDTNIPEKKTRLLKSKEELKQLDPKSTDIYQDNAMQYYLRRPDSLYNYTYYGFKRHIGYTKNKKLLPKWCLPDNYYFNQQKQIYYWKLPTPVIVQAKYHSPQEGEQYFYQKLLEHAPHKRHNLISQTNKSKTYLEECFIRECLVDNTSDENTMLFWKSSSLNKKLMHQILIRLQQGNNTQNFQGIINKHIKALQEIIDEDIEDIDEINIDRLTQEQRIEYEELKQDNMIDAIVDEELDYNYLLVPQLVIELYESYRLKLSDEQRLVINYIFDNIQHHRYILLFISGSAGTGKSYLIQQLRTLFEHVLNLNCEITATTGTAASNIGGKTLHSMIQIGKDMKSVWVEPFSPFQVYLDNIDVVIIDEVSMLTDLTLNQLEATLRKGSSNQQQYRTMFGQKHIILVGDLSQLPPVTKANQSNSNSFINNELFKNFTWIQLEKIFRQQQDNDFIQILDEIRHNTLSANSIQNLRMRECINHNKLINCDIMSGYNQIICSNNYEKDQYNDFVIRHIFSQSQLIVLKSTDTIKSGDLIRQIDPETDQIIIKKIQQRKYSLKQIINIYLNMKIMITQNVDVSLQQTNGTLAIITEIPDNHLYLVILNLSSNKKQFLRRKEEIMDIDGFKIYRRQFPIVPAYASTIHKIQGQTLDNVIIDCSNLFEEGHFYTAISRVRSLDQVHLINFKPDIIMQNQFIIDMQSANKEIQKNVFIQYNTADVQQNTLNVLQNKIKHFTQQQIDKVYNQRTKQQNVVPQIDITKYQEIYNQQSNTQIEQEIQDFIQQQQVPSNISNLVKIEISQLMNQKELQQIDTSMQIDTSTQQVKQQDSQDAMQIDTSTNQQQRKQYPWIRWYLNSCLHDSITTIYFFTMFNKDQDVQRAHMFTNDNLNQACNILSAINVNQEYQNAQVCQRQQGAIQLLRQDQPIHMRRECSELQHIKQYFEENQLYSLEYTIKQECVFCPYRNQSELRSTSFQHIPYDNIVQCNNWIEKMYLDDLKPKISGCIQCGESQCISNTREYTNIPRYMILTHGEQDAIKALKVKGQFKVQNQEYEIIGMITIKPNPYSPDSNHFLCYFKDGVHSNDDQLNGWWKFDSLDHEIQNLETDNIQDVLSVLKRNKEYHHLLVYKQSQ